MSATYLDIALRLNGREVLTTSEAPSAASEAQRTMAVGNRNYAAALHATSTPKLDKPPVSLVLTLSAPTTINLAAIAGLALPGTATRTLDLTGARPKAFLFRAGPTNHAAGITIEEGAAQPYPLFGAGNVFVLLPGMVVAVGFAAVESTLPAVAAGVRNILFTGGAVTDVLYWDLYTGTT